MGDGVEAGAGVETAGWGGVEGAGEAGVEGAGGVGVGEVVMGV